MNESFNWKQDYDFIEEGLGTNPEPLSFSEINEDIICESKSNTLSNRKIIGKIAGCFQEVGGFSRNNRYYLPEHWKIQLDKPELQERLRNGDILGTTGHFDRPVIDEDIREGRVSHIVRVLEIREDAKGKPFLYGEMEILDTKAGRNLKALYEGGANLYVSSRAAGKLLDTPGKPYKTVDPMHFTFCTFDTVRRPGFLSAKPVYEGVTANSQPQLHESQKEDLPKQKEVHEEDSNFVNNPAKWTKEPDAECQSRKDAYEKAVAKHSELKKNDLAGKNPETQAAYKEAVQAYRDLEKARKDHYPNYKTLQDIEKTQESEDITTLKSQVQQLAQLVEKVVDSIYEQPNVNERAEALGQCISLLGESDLSEEAFDQIIDIIKKGIK